MITVQTATEKAREFARSVIDPQLRYSLEEIDSDTYKEREVWALTLGYPKVFNTRPGSPLSPGTSIAKLFGSELDYKVFMVDKETGEVIAMKVRALSR